MRVLGELVANTLGGKISKQQVRKIGYEMHIIELKRAKASNVIPIGSLKLGLYRERALLFKLLADLTGVPATLGKFHSKVLSQKIWIFFHDCKFSGTQKEKAKITVLSEVFLWCLGDS